MGKEMIGGRQSWVRLGRWIRGTKGARPLRRTGKGSENNGWRRRQRA